MKSPAESGTDFANLANMRNRASISSVCWLWALAGLAGCSNTPITPIEPCTKTITTSKLQQSSVDKIDILLALDNSRSMADKQQILALAVPDLVKSLINPRCLDDIGQPAPNQPNGPLEKCPTGTHRESEPILDIHIGVISTSIGGHGADSCPDIDTASKECAPKPNTTNNDHGHLLARTDPCSLTTINTYDGKGFLAWDPTQTLTPPGENVLDDGQNGIVPSLRNMVMGVGQIGCGYESQLESIYRFLADPNPYESIAVDNYQAAPSGTDTNLLAQRKDFLRPDSLLSVILLTDENDCSIKEYAQFYYVGQLRNGAAPVRLPRARQECAKNPHDPCCASCGQATPPNCPVDPTCADPNGGAGPALLSDTEDNINLRCWDQKRRFGIDFLYPTDRYVQAFSSSMIYDRDGNVAPNPIFTDLDPTDANDYIRDSGMVFFTGIVGVPWEDIARDKTDLKKGFKDGNELVASVGPNGENTWDIILGDPAKNIKPLNPLMIETYQKRTGTDPITGYTLVDSTMALGNPTNGHEWTIANDDLQYACIMPLLAGTERDCTNTNLPACDCTIKTNDNPLCAQDPNNMNNPTMQVRAKAYPGLRPLTVIRDLGTQGMVGSVCAAQLSDQSETATDFGYRASVNAVTDRLKTAISGQCFQSQLFPDESGQVACRIIEARRTAGQCNCDPTKARLPIEVGSDAETAVNQAKQDPLATKAGWDCYCEIPQLAGDELNACQNDTSDDPVLNGQQVNGWCYVDADQSPAIGNPDILAKCPDNEKRLVRFVGAGDMTNRATVFLSCQTSATACN